MKFLKVQMFLLWVILANGGAQAAVPANCMALVQFKSDLWLASYDGSLVKRLTSDGRMKMAAALSENGKVVAFTGEPSNEVTLLSADGRILDRVDVGAEDGITSLQWDSASILRCGEHVSPSSSLFHFLKMNTNTYDGAVLLPTPAVAGQNCQLSPNDKDMACVEGGRLPWMGARYSMCRTLLLGL